MSTPLMPKATAIWLLDNTSLTFKQIADFCGLHILELQAIANNQTDHGMIPVNPITNGQLTWEEIERCMKDESAVLQMCDKTDDLIPKKLKKTKKYTPLAKRHDRPNAILWILKNHPNMADADIVRLLNTTKTMIKSIREKSHHNIAGFTPWSPVQLGLCSEADLEKAINKSDVANKLTETPAVAVKK